MAGVQVFRSLGLGATGLRVLGFGILRDTALEFVYFLGFVNGEPTIQHFTRRIMKVEFPSECRQPSTLNPKRPVAQSIF